MKYFKSLIHISLIISVLLLYLLGASASIFAKEITIPEITNERLLVNFEPGTNWAEMMKTHQTVGVTFESVIPGVGTHIVTVPKNQGWLKKLAYGINSNVYSVETDTMAEVIDQPNDQYYTRQYGLEVVQAVEAWAITTGSHDCKIAILDTGIDLEQVDLNDKLVTSINFTSSPTADANGHSHGTHVAGIAAAETNNSIGVAGLGYNCSLMNVKVMDDDGYGYYSWIAEGVTWAADNGANVISMSLGATVPSATLESAINYAWNKGVVVVAAAGNNGSSTPFYPAYYTNCIAVAASDSYDRLTSWSNYGEWVDVAAPGSSIYSTMPDNCYAYKSGTSMSAPFVAGLAGLVFGVVSDTNGNGRLNDEVRSAIETTCDNPGIDVAYGRINAYRAVQSMPAPSGQISGIVTDNSNGIPVSGAIVQSGLFNVATDINGYYLFDSIPVGTYEVLASAEGYQAASNSVVVTDGSAVTANFGLMPINNSPILDTIGNKIAKEGELLQFTISATDLDGDPLIFSTNNLPSGASFDPISQIFSWTPEMGQAGTYNGIHFEVSDGSLHDWEDITITVNAVVTNGGITGMVIDDESGSPIGGASISTGGNTVYTDINGAFAINDLDTGYYNVVAGAPGYVAMTKTDIYVYRGQDTVVNFTLKPETVEKALWVRSIDFTPAGKNLKICVSVVSPEPVIDGVVDLELTQGTALIATFSGTTDASGEVMFMQKKLDAGDYTTKIVAVTKSGYLWYTSQGVVTAEYYYTTAVKGK